MARDALGELPMFAREGGGFDRRYRTAAAVRLVSLLPAVTSHLEALALATGLPENLDLPKFIEALIALAHSRGCGSKKAHDVQN